MAESKEELKSFLSSVGKESTCNVGDLDLILGLGRSPGEGKGYPLQYSDLENSMGCIVHGVAKSWTQLKDLYLKRVKKESKNAGLKLSIQKTKMMASDPIT